MDNQSISTSPKYNKLARKSSSPEPLYQFAPTNVSRREQALYNQLQPKEERESQPPGQNIEYKTMPSGLNFYGIKPTQIMVPLRNNARSASARSASARSNSASARSRKLSQLRDVDGETLKIIEETMLG